MDENIFASAQSVLMLDYAYLGAVSPENLAADGERDLDTQRVLMRRIQRDYTARREELLAVA